MNWECCFETYILPYVEQIDNGKLLYNTGSSVLCDYLEEWDGVGVGEGFKREGMVDLQCCTAETNTTV